MEGEVSVPSPDKIDPLTQTTSGAATALPLDSSQNMTPRHQGDQNTGGACRNMRVLKCSNVDLSLDYEGLYAIMKNFGEVERMKLSLSTDKQTFVLYVTFMLNESALEANRKLNGHSINGCRLNTVMYPSSKLIDDEFDYIPANYEPSVTEKTIKDPPNLVWHVATFKEGKENMIKAADYIQRKVGKVPEHNLKRYGKGILIKAANDTQATLLKNFQPSQCSNILKITPHASFNTQRAMIYSKDLYEFSEEEILNMCPSNVCEVRKMKGSDNAIMLILTSRFHMDSIAFNHVRIKVKKYRPNPTQCRKCFEYGHIISNCSNKLRCSNCSGLHEEDECNRPKFCFQCDGPHSPNDKRCARFRFEQEVRETINTCHVSVGEAKRLVLGANKSPNSNFAAVARRLKPQAKTSATTTTHPKPQSNNSYKVLNPLSGEDNTVVALQTITAALPNPTNQQSETGPQVNTPSQSSSKDLSSSDLQNLTGKASRHSGKPRRSSSVEHQKSRSPVRSSASPQNKKIKKSTSNNSVADPTTSEKSLPETSSSVSGTTANDCMSVSSGELADNDVLEHQKNLSNSATLQSCSGSRSSPPPSSRGKPAKLTRDVVAPKPTSSQSKQGKTGSFNFKAK